MIDTPRLAGAPVGEDDLPFLIEMYEQERVMTYLGGVRDAAYARKRLDGWLGHWDEHGWGATVFRHRETGERIGWGGLQHSTIGRGEEHITVGYIVRPEAWGQGHATEITVASLRYAFDGLGLDEVFASVAAAHRASRRVLEKAGLRLVEEIDHGTYGEAIYRVAR